MSYESVVLHAGDHGAATVVLPVPRLRTIYTASEADGNVPVAPASPALLYDRGTIEARDDGYTVLCVLLRSRAVNIVNAPSIRHRRHWRLIPDEIS